MYINILILCVKPETVELANSIRKDFSELKVLKTENEILRHNPKKDYDFICCDFQLFKRLPFSESDFDTRSTLIGYNSAKTRIVLFVEKADMKEASPYLESQANSYISYPVDRVELKLHLQKRPEFPPSSIAPGSWLPDDSAMMRTNGPQMKQVYEQLSMVALKNTTVLLTGETGTGKGILARLIHTLSPRRAQPFISIHCGAIPENLLESELFGHEKGAFTGATKLKKGKFELADGGTLFLDEIGTISKDVQIKLLKALQERSIERLGGEKSISVDLKIIAATNENLKELCDENRFRLDLYYRLNVFPIKAPPLRERAEDLPLICASLINKFNTLHNKDINGIHPLLAEALQNYDWPGNIRELENLIERAFILEEGNTLSPSSFPVEMLGFVNQVEQLTTSEVSPGTLRDVRRQVISQVEEEYIRSTLSTNNGSIKMTAATAGITTRQLNKLMSRYSIDKNIYKSAP